MQGRGAAKLRKRRWQVRVHRSWSCRGRRRVLLCGLALCAGLAILLGTVGGAAASPAKTAIPVNACKLKLAKQLKALRLTASCRAVKPGASPFGKVSSGTWGTQPHVLGIGFFAFSNGAKLKLFKRSFFTIGSTVPVSGGVESVGPLGVAYAGIVDGIGINLSVNEQAASTAVKNADAKKVLALVKAVAAQL
jgi:hypothetical protein